MNNRFTTNLNFVVAFLVAGGVFLPMPSAAAMEFDRIYQEYLDETYPTVLVTAHRGGYQQFGAVIHPENSLSAIGYSIGLGVDIVEIDVRKTLDGELVVMHDSTVNRTTTGSGTVANMTLAQIKSLNLLYLNQPTAEKVPTLTEVMQLAKDNIMINVDKAFGIDILEDVIAVLQATDTLDHAIFKGRTSSAQDAANALQELSTPVDYMPILHTGDSIVRYFNELSPESVEMIFSTPTSNLIAPAVINYTNTNGGRVGMSSLSVSSAASHTDGNALLDPAANWGWMVDKGAQIIQTDEPEALINYLASEGLRGGNADFDNDEDVDGGDFLAWQRGFGLVGTATSADGDANGDDDVNDLDLFFWQTQYSTKSGTSLLQSLTVPEPATLSNTLICMLLFILLQRQYLSGVALK